MTGLKAYQDSFETYLNETVSVGSPEGLYLPIQYLLELGGKRLRPILVLMAAEAFGSQKKEALPAALAVEIFHNFTLMHDDIMDEAPLRRGADTVHQKWNINTAILSGDAMMIQSYQALESYNNSLFGKLTRLLSKTAIEVCEGQQFDLDFESDDATWNFDITGDSNKIYVYNYYWQGEEKAQSAWHTWELGGTVFNIETK